MKRKYIKVFYRVILLVVFMGFQFYLVKRILHLENELIFLHKTLNILLDEKLSEDIFIKEKLKIISQYIQDKVLAVRILKAIKKYSSIYELDSDLVFSIIYKESEFNHKAVSSKGAIGLMQVLPETADLVARYLGRFFYDLYDIEDNIEIGCAYFHLLSRYNDLEVALRKYYAGKYFEGEEAKRYAKGILSYYDSLKMME